MHPEPHKCTVGGRLEPATNGLPKPAILAATDVAGNYLCRNVFDYQYRRRFSRRDGRPVSDSAGSLVRPLVWRLVDEVREKSG
jgi:hypothetical protein